MIVPFEIPFDQDMTDDLRRRLASVRWNDAVTTDWSQGTQSSFLAALMGHWRDHYDWRDHSAVLNRLPHRRATIDGYGVHALHFRGQGARPIPLLLMNGWPSSFVEYQRLVPLLTAGDPSFDIVIPTHPGFGYSDKPSRPYQIEPAELYPKLMTALGYDRFFVAGTDVGSGVATRIALLHPDRVLALHVSAVAPKPDRAGDRPATEAQADYARRAAIWSKDEGGYQAIQSSKPQTLSYGLADSPVGLASWIVEKFHGWTDCGGDLLSVWPMETLIDNLMIYWATNTIGSSVRYYYDGTRLRPPLRADDFVRAPTAVAMWPQDLALAPRELAERLYNVRRYTIMPKGGHFPAWEAPDLYADDLRCHAIDSIA
ncbi:epoxide hydrolase [Sphingomonas sp. PAMC26645]|uniref:epoxide hydrolase family protein n=1 Tax=Sphingomonas sp. PAMC26645 TaxID=2565555 RepID=UPI00109DDB65|nr:epoxide hydrolase family protein [Sphingomonas sp. PAMC26645]QCB43294.1 epoxide hydrolase [Sphingomonas sp. PAMC26645]